MPDVNFNSKEDLLNFKIGLMANQEMYYQEKIEELKTERTKTEANLKIQLHKLNIIAYGLIAVLLTLLIGLFIILMNTEIIIDTNSGSASSNETYGDMTFSGDSARFKTNDISIMEGIPYENTDNS